MQVEILRFAQNGKLNAVTLSEAKGLNSIIQLIKRRLKNGKNETG